MVFADEDQDEDISFDVGFPSDDEPSAVSDTNTDTDLDAGSLPGGNSLPGGIAGPIPGTPPSPPAPTGPTTSGPSDTSEHPVPDYGRF